MDIVGDGCFFIVSAPSGGGKTTLVKTLIRDMPQISVSISHTTRKKRPAEVDGVDYFFVDEDEFMSLVNAGAFVEHARVFGHLYGTTVLQIRSRLEAGIDVVLDIDWQGAQQIKRAFPTAISIFIVPPSLEILRQRLLHRHQDDATIIEQRMQAANEELSHYIEFDYLIINDSFDVAATQLKSIVIAHRLRIERQVQQHGELLSLLLQK